MSALQVRPAPLDEPPFRMGAPAAEVYSKLGGLVATDRENGWAAAALIDGLCSLLTEIDRANTPDWGSVLSPDRCPWWALRWAGQVYGVRLGPQLEPWERPDAVTEQRWRQAIRDRVNWRRGTPAVVLAAVREYLKANANPKLRERTSAVTPGDQPYQVVLSVPIDDVREEFVVGTRAASNLVTNPVFSTGTGQWSVRSAVLAQSTAYPGSGTHSLRVQAGSLSDPHAWSSIGLQPPGTVLSAGAWVTNPVDAVGPVRVSLRLAQAGLWPSEVASASVTLVPGQREFLSITGVVPPSPAWDELEAIYPTWQDVLDEFPTWQALVDGFPVWADISDVSARIILGAPRDPTAGTPMTGRAVYWADPHVNVGATLNVFGHGGLSGWSWSGTAFASTSSKPDTRSSPILERAFKDALPIGLVGSLVHASQATWLAAVAKHGTWQDAINSLGPGATWQQLINSLLEDD